MSETVSEQKTVLRRAALARRDDLAAEERARLSARIVERLQALLREQAPRVVGAYAPIRSEVDVWPLFETLAAAGIETALPVTSGGSLLFRRWRPGDVLVTAAFGIREPQPDAPVVIPDLILMPVVAFDRQGGRLGYGKGHYDRAVEGLALSGNAPRLVGVAFAAQEVPPIPVEAHDTVFDLVVTEGETIVLAKD